MVEDDLGIEVTSRYRMLGGVDAARLIQYVTDAEPLQEHVRAADAVFFNVPLADTAGKCHPDVVPAEDIASCATVQLDTYADLAATLVDEIVALRSPEEAIIRVTDTWQFGRAKCKILACTKPPQPSGSSSRTRSSPTLPANTECPSCKRATRSVPPADPIPSTLGTCRSTRHISRVRALSVAELFLETGYAPLR